VELFDFLNLKLSLQQENMGKKLIGSFVNSVNAELPIDYIVKEDINFDLNENLSDQLQVEQEKLQRRKKMPRGGVFSKEVSDIHSLMNVSMDKLTSAICNQIKTELRAYFSSSRFYQIDPSDVSNELRPGLSLIRLVLESIKELSKTNLFHFISLFASELQEMFVHNLIRRDVHQDYNVDLNALFHLFNHFSTKPENLYFRQLNEFRRLVSLKSSKRDTLLDALQSYNFHTEAETAREILVASCSVETLPLDTCVEVLRMKK
jgi:hypothetical protein